MGNHPNQNITEAPSPPAGAGVSKLAAFNQLRCPLPNFSSKFFLVLRKSLVFGITSLSYIGASVLSAPCAVSSNYIKIKFSSKEQFWANLSIFEQFRAILSKFEQFRAISSKFEHVRACLSNFEHFAHNCSKLLIIAQNCSKLLISNDYHRPHKKSYTFSESSQETTVFSSANLLIFSIFAPFRSILVLNFCFFNHLPLLSNFEQFWAIMSNYEQLWAILNNYEQLWASAQNCSKLLIIAQNQLWAILSNYEKLWAIM